MDSLFQNNKNTPSCLYHFRFIINIGDIKTITKIALIKTNTIKLFENLLSGNSDSIKELNQIIYPTTNTQYKRNIILLLNEKNKKVEKITGVNNI